LNEAERQAFELIQERKRAYQLVFTGPSGQMVLENLAVFCRANESCFHADPRIHAVLEGRREVYLRIREHLDLTTEQLFEFYTQRLLNQLNQEAEDA
jgi:hypothetical protein